MDVSIGDLRLFLDLESLTWFLTVMIAATLPLGWLAGNLHRRRQNRTICQALGNSSRGRLVQQDNHTSRGLLAEIKPAPEPYLQLQFIFVARSFLNPMELPSLLLGKKKSSLTVEGLLSATPNAELIWIRGQIPDKALGQNPGDALWTYHRLDFIGAVFATRGTGTAALQHVHTELHKRFGPMLQRVSVQRSPKPAVSVHIHTAGIPMEDIPALVESVRALGRAALLHKKSESVVRAPTGSVGPAGRLP